jgi:hypothetical protein
MRFFALQTAQRPALWTDACLRLWRTRTEIDAYVADPDPVYGWQVAELEAPAELIYSGRHSVGGFSIWSDGVIRRLTYVVENYRHTLSAWGEDRPARDVTSDRPVTVNNGGLTDAAVALIRTALGSDSRKPDWLWRVRDVVYTSEGHSQAKTGGYAGRKVDQVRITLDDGSTLDQWIESEGYFEGYSFEFSGRRPTVERRGWFDRECLECGAVFDQAGYVEPGAMGCDRCNGELATDWNQHLVREGQDDAREG